MLKSEREWQTVAKEKEAKQDFKNNHACISMFIDDIMTFRLLDHYKMNFDAIHNRENYYKWSNNQALSDGKQAGWHKIWI